MECLNILEHLDGLSKLYTQICFCYHVPSEKSQQEIIDKLNVGLRRLGEAFPWLAGQVVDEHETSGDNGSSTTDENTKTGRQKIVSFELSPRLIVKDHRENSKMPTMTELTKDKFPFRLLDEDKIAPLMTLPGVGTPDESLTGIAPVFLLQANFIVDGLILTINGQHNTMDMTSQGHVIRLLSKACRGEDFTHEELKTFNTRRPDIIPLLDEPYKPGSELEFQLVRSSPSEPASAPVPEEVEATASPPPTCTWTYFSFPAQSLASIKSLATKTISNPSESQFISTDDALTAFVWKHVTQARLARISDSARSADSTGSNTSSPTTTLARAVNVRRYLDISPLSPGLIQNMTYHKYDVSAFLALPFGDLALALRKAVDPRTSNLAYATKSLATYLSKSLSTPPSKTKTESESEGKEDDTVSESIGLTSTISLATDLMLSSWAAVQTSDLDFGLGLGPPKAVRRPAFTPVESLAYFMPKSADGEISLGVCLRDEDLEKLSADDGEFMTYATMIL